MPANIIYPPGITKGTAEVAAELLLQSEAEEIHVPLCADFRLLLALRSRGVPAERLHAYDVSLYASLIGYLADPRQDLAALELSLEVPWPVEAASESQHAAHAILGMKYEQVRPAHFYAQNIRREMRYRWERYLAEIEAELQGIVSALGPIHYAVMDHRDVIESIRDVKSAAIFIAPPPFKASSYRKAFPHDKVRWKHHLPLAWGKYSLPEITDALTDAKAFALVFTGESGAPMAWDNVLGLGGRKGEAEYLSANRAIDMARIEAKVSVKEPVRFEIYDDQEIGAETKLTFVEIDKETALYYRDLFVHNLGATSSELYLAMLLDGRLTTVIGLNHARLMHHKTEYLSETFGISKTSARYPKLGKLFMMAMSTTAFRDLIEAHIRIGIRKIRGVETTSLSRLPENKIHRGTGFKVTSREQQEDGTWKLRSKGDFRDETFDQVLDNWLKKHGQQAQVEAA